MDKMMTMDEALEKYARGCKWFVEHPECFKVDKDTGIIEILVEVPEEAQYYVLSVNEQEEELMAQEALGLESDVSYDGVPVEVW